MNKVILMGRLTRDPDIRQSQGENGTLVARFTLAVDRRFRRDNNDSADFISCVAFGKLAEFAEKYLSRGKKVVLTGRIQTGSYTNREGQKVYTTDVVAEEIEFAESKNAESRGGSDYSGGYSGGGYSGGSDRDYGSRPSYGGGSSYSDSSSSSPAPDSGADMAPAGGSGFDDGFMNVPEGIDDELPFN